MNDYMNDDSTQMEVSETDQRKAGVPTSQADVLGLLNTAN